jgi:hypothetical protein
MASPGRTGGGGRGRVLCYAVKYVVLALNTYVCEPIKKLKSLQWHASDLSMGGCRYFYFVCMQNKIATGIFSSVALRVIQRNDLCSVFSVVDVLGLILLPGGLFAPCSNIVIEHLQIVKSFLFIFKNEVFPF